MYEDFDEFLKEVAKKVGAKKKNDKAWILGWSSAISSFGIGSTLLMGLIGGPFSYLITGAASYFISREIISASKSRQDRINRAKRIYNNIQRQYKKNMLSMTARDNKINELLERIFDENDSLL